MESSILILSFFFDGIIITIIGISSQILPFFITGILKTAAFSGITVALSWI
jgi:hypothetical protein